MKAAQINDYGDASVIVINEVDKPTAGEGQVLVAVHAASINPFDSSVRSGRLKDAIPLQLPVTLGGDLAGVVEAVGGGVMQFAVGDKVYGQAAVVAGNSGSIAEFAVTKAGQLAKMPSNVEFGQAASLALVGASAVQALIEHLNLQPGQKMLITGGTGGIGSLAIQIAKHIGAHVTATASGDGVELAKQLGADEVIDYTQQDVGSLPRDFDVAFNTVRGDMFDKVLHVVKEGGTAVNMNGDATEGLAEKLKVTAIAQNSHVTTEHLDTLREMVEAGAVKPQVDQTFDLAHTADAFRAKEAGNIKGKVVITIR